MTIAQNALAARVDLWVNRKRRRVSLSRGRLVSAVLLSPLIAFILLAFALPIAIVLFYAINNPEVGKALPQTITALQDWSGTDLPPPGAMEALIRDLRLDPGDSRVAEAGRRLNYEITGFRTLLLKTARAARAGGLDEAIARQALTDIDPRWGEGQYWTAIQRSSAPFTLYYLLAAVDLRIDADGALALAPAGERVFLAALARTMWIGFVVTLICLLIGYPIANAIATLPGRFPGVMLACVLLPFWTSLLVRTSAWIVILQKEGIVNTALMHAGLITAPLDLMFNRVGLYVTMVHILLPFMVLPLLSVMKGLPPTYMRASASLGAHPVSGFLRIYLPLTLPGVGAGCLLTFIVASGYYITPTLVGGAGDQMLSYFVAFFANATINWGMSSALALVLLTCILVLYVCVGRIIGINRIAGIS